MWGQEQINQLLLLKLCHVTPNALEISKIPRKLLNKIFESLELPHEVNSEVTCGTHCFSPLSECHTCPLRAQGLPGEVITPDLCCSRRNRTSMSRRFSSAARPGNLPVRTANLFHAWPAPKGCAAGLGNEKCHLQLCIFSSSSIMQIPPPQICSKCFVCVCRSTTNLLWSNINMGSTE